MNKEESKKAMLRVRAYVKNFTMKGKNPDKLDNLSQYPKNMGDAKRTIIALQDLLEATNERHKKASDNVVLYKAENFKHYKAFIQARFQISALYSMMDRNNKVAFNKIKMLKTEINLLKQELQDQVILTVDAENNKKNIARVLKDSLNGEFI